MHLYFFLRGIYHEVELYKAYLQSQFWKWRRKNLETGEEELVLFQGALRPSVMGAYEYIFPEEALSEVLAMFRINDTEEVHVVGANPSFKNTMKLAVLREMFDCEAIPEKNLEEASKVAPSVILENLEKGWTNVLARRLSVHPIGIKRDIRRDFPEIKRNMEAL